MQQRKRIVEYNLCPDCDNPVWAIGLSPDDKIKNKELCRKTYGHQRYVAMTAWALALEECVKFTSTTAEKAVKKWTKLFRS